MRGTTLKTFKKSVRLLLIAYLTLPFLIFVGGWMKLYIAIPVILLVLFCAWKVYQDMPELWLPELTQDNLIKILFIIGVFAIWVYYSGIGKFVFQNSDHATRNGLFNILVQYDWPVINDKILPENQGILSKTGMIYYIGFWLPSAVVGKVLGLRAGYYAQAVWALLGIVLTYFLICHYFKKLKVWPVFVFIFFSGLDIVGAYLTSMDYINSGTIWHLEWWGTPYQYSSMTTQLFWVFNQAIPAWLCTMLAYIQKNNRNLVYILACCMLSSTLPFVGLLAIILYLGITRKPASLSGKCSWKERLVFLIKDTCTLQNVLGGGLIGILSFLYLWGNLSGTHLMGENVRGAEFDNSLAKLVLFLLLDIGVYVVLLYQYHKKDMFFYFVVLCLCLIPIFKVGYSNDFCMRASIPGLFLIMVWVMEALSASRKQKNYLLLCGLIAVLLVGSVTPVFEFRRTLTETYRRINSGEIVYAEDSKEVNILNSPNFSGDVEQSFFYKYLAK